MKILQLNCSGFTKEVSAQLARYVDSKHVDVICLQETFAKDDHTTFRNWKPYTKHSPDGYGGVAIFVSPLIKSVPCEELSDPNLEAVWSKVQVAGKVTLLGSVYIRPGQMDKVALLEDKIKGLPSSHQLIVMGDLNGHSQLWDNGYTQTRMDPARRIGIQIENLIIQENLLLHNTGHSTFIHRRDHSAWALDLTLSKNLRAQTRWQSDPLSSLKSDHFPTMLHVDCNESFRKTKWDLANTDWEVWNEAVELAINDILADGSLHTKSPNDQCLTVQDKIMKLAENKIPKKTICQHSKAFFTPKLSQLHKKFRAAKKKYEYRSDEHNLKNLDLARDELNAEYTKEHDNFWKTVCQNTESHELWSTVSKITSSNKHLAIQPMRNVDGTFEFSDEKIAERLKCAHVTKDNIDTTQFDDQWYDQVNAEVMEIINSERLAVAEQFESGNEPSEIYNKDLSVSSVDRMVDSLKVNSSPGPDNILPIMIKKAKEPLVPLLTTMYQSCWETGVVPVPWKKDKRVFIPKPGSDPHVEKGLRGLSLNPIIGKGMERIVTQRLIWWLETNFKLFDDQYAYRKFRGVVQAMLHFICSVRRGFEEDKVSVAALVDLHAAFDTVWRNGIIYKLHFMGVRGRMLLYVNSFLTDRKSKLLVNTYESDWISTKLGVPQGAIIAPILFLCYIADMSLNLNSSIGFADDLTMWITHVDPVTACRILESDLQTLSNWTRKWRLIINGSKTEVMCIAKQGHIPVQVNLDGSILQQVPHKRCLGITVDSNLKFTKHVENIKTKALKSLSSINRLLDETGGMRTALGLRLYKALVLPILTYGYPVWCTISNSLLNSIEDVHEAALRKVTGVHSSAPTNAVEVIIGALPFRLQLREILACEYLRIMRKEPGAVIKRLIMDSIDSSSTQQNPGKLMKVALRDTSRQVNLEYLDPEPTYSADSFDTTIGKCSVSRWQDLGSSKNRTEQQKILTAQSMEQHILGISADTLPIFTDGSALGNPGPCGCSAVIYTHGISNDPIIISEPVAMRSTSFHGEVAAIKLALKYLQDNSQLQFREALIHSDCRAAIDAIINNTGNLTNLRSDIVKLTKALNNKGVKVTLCWIPGHAGITANELADHSAKEAAEKTKTWTQEQNSCVITLNCVKNQLRVDLVNTWQRQWDVQTEGRFTHEILPKVKLKRYKGLQHDKPLRQADCRLNRIQSGCTLLRSHPLRQRLDARAGIPVSIICDCGQSPQDLEHYLLDCDLMREERAKLIHNIMELVLKFNLSHNKISVHLLLGDPEDVPNPVKAEIRRAVVTFITDTCSKINI